MAQSDSERVRERLTHLVSTSQQMQGELSDLSHKLREAVGEVESIGGARKDEMIDAVGDADKRTQDAGASLAEFDRVAREYVDTRH